MLSKICLSLVIIFLLLITSCSDSKKEVLDKFYSNKESFELIKDKFINLPTPFTIIRRDYGYRIEYEMGTLGRRHTNIQNLQIEGSYAKNEEEFWRQDYSKIFVKKRSRDLSTDNVFITMSLSEFLDTCKISKELFNEFRIFLTTNELSGIQKGIPDTNLVIYFKGIKGLIYSINEYKKPNYPESHEIIKIEGHWYYYGN